MTEAPKIGHVYVNRATGKHAVIVEHVSDTDVLVCALKQPLHKGGEHQSQWMFTPAKEDVSGWIPWMRFVAEFRQVSGG